MTSILIASFVAVLTFGSGILGLFFERRLPKEHMSGGSREMILAVIGLVTLLLALVLGTLIGNTYAFFAAQKSELETYASRAVLHRRGVGNVPVLRVRGAFGQQSNNHRRARVGSNFGGQCDFPDPRPEVSLIRACSAFRRRRSSRQSRPSTNSRRSPLWVDTRLRMTTTSLFRCRPRRRVVPDQTPLKSQLRLGLPLLRCI